MANVKEEIANKLVSMVVDSEYVTGIQNNKEADADYQDYLDMFDCERNQKNYDWNSDIFFPEFFAQQITQMSTEAGSMFKTYDFVEVYGGDDDEASLRSAKASKGLINKTLNRRRLYFYHKYMRAVGIKNLSGAAYFRCWWEQKTRSEVTGTRRNVRSLNVDINGDPVISPDQINQQEFFDEDVVEDRVLFDHFNFDIMSGEDVFTDRSYAYSLQDKQWVIIRFEKTIDELESEADDMEYFNLDKLTAPISNDVSDKNPKSGRTSHHGIDNKQAADKEPLKPYTILQRFGKHMVVVDEFDDDGNASVVSPGIDESGSRKKGATFAEMVMTFAINDNKKVLIGYNPVRTIDANGDPYRPLGRLLCYIHPKKDDGMGDGKAAVELQVAINDTLNMEADRTKLATIPIMQGNQFNITDNTSLEWKPGAFWETEDGNLFEEVRISGDVQGSLNEVALYRQMSQQASGISQEDQALLPPASQTATASARQAQQSDNRSDFRALTGEFTGMSELYWFIIQMSAQFMKRETAEKWLGDDMVFFNPTLDHVYKPLTAALDSDSSRQTKIQNWIQLYSFTAQRQDVDPSALNFILAQIAELQGKEYEAFSNKFFLPPGAPPTGGGNQPPAATGQAATNQTGIPQNQAEVQTREIANAI
jgi:hypothetical protein